MKLRRTAIVALFMAVLAWLYVSRAQQAVPVGGGSNGASTAEQSLKALAVNRDAPSNEHPAHYRYNGQAPLNDLAATPGDVDPSLTKEKLCDPSFHTATVRHVTQSTKVAVCRAYGQTEGCPGSGYEIDHLVSLELGGSDDAKNLWPQPVDEGPDKVPGGVIGFHTKDKVENAAHRAVCSGAITLEQAQHGIATDWYQFGIDNKFITGGQQ